MLTGERTSLDEVCISSAMIICLVRWSLEYVSDGPGERCDSEGGGVGCWITSGAATTSSSRAPSPSDVLHPLDLSSSGGHEVCNDLESTNSSLEGVGIGSAGDKSDKDAGLLIQEKNNETELRTIRQTPPSLEKTSL
jgi:hypothetical protein